jgi:DNA polymerase-1
MADRIRHARRHHGGADGSRAWWARTCATRWTGCRARELVTVKTDCDLTDAVADFQALHDLGEDKEKLIAFFQRYGFKTWLREATGEALPNARAAARGAEARAGAGRSTRAAPADAPPKMCAGRDPLRDRDDRGRARRVAAQDRDAPIVAVDTETTSLDPMLALVGISLSVEPGAAAYIRWRIAARTSRAENRQLARVRARALRAWLEDPTRPSSAST